MLLRDRFVETIVKAYPAVAACQTAEGWLAYDGNKYTMYSQFAGFYLAWLYTCEHPLNVYSGSADVLDRARRVWDHYATRINDEGLYRIISGNQDYGYSLDEWGLFYWMKSAELLRGCLPTEKVSEWDNTLKRIANKLLHMIRYPETLDDDHGYNFRRNFAHHTSNHYVWCLLSCYVFGKLHGDKSAIETATVIMDEVFDHQLPSGCWLECGSPTVLYNDVTLSAISLYEYYAGNARASCAIRKGLDYVLNTMYPDFSRIETIDGRNRYRRHDFGLCVPTYGKYEQGRMLLSEWIQRADKSNALIGDNLHGLANVTAMLEAIPADAQFLPGNNWATLNLPARTEFPELMARVHREHEWVIPCCCMEQKEYDNRYVLYRQNLFSVFHGKAGLLIGGGHSIAQPQFSCFNVVSGDKMYYMHENGALLQNGIGMLLQYGRRNCSIRISDITESSLSIHYSVVGLSEVDRVYVNIPLVGQLGDSMFIDGMEASWGEQPLTRNIEAGSALLIHSAQISVSENALYQYPVFPYNSYLQKQQRSFNEVFGIITVELDYMRPEVHLHLLVP